MLQSENRESGKTVIPEFISKALFVRKMYLSGYGFTDFICFQARATYLHTLDTVTYYGTNLV